MAWRLAREYHERTEAFDEANCQNPSCPVGDERKISMQNASRIYRELLDRHTAMRIMSVSLWSAIRADVRHFKRDWKAGDRYFVSPINKRFN